MYRGYRPPAGGGRKTNRTLEIVVAITVTMLLGWSLLGAPEHTKPPVLLTKTSDIVAMPLTEASLMWASIDGEFGAEGAAATMIGGYPSPIQTPTVLVIMDEGERENSAVRAVSSVLKRWCERVKRPTRTTTSLYPDKTPPTVVVITPCDQDKQTVRRLTGCDDCTSATLESKLAKLQYDSVKGPLLLIPSDMLHEGLLMMNKIFNYNPGDLLYLEGGPDSKKGCRDTNEGELYKLAVSSLRKRMERYADEFQPHLESFTAALAALPNYCQGMYPFSQCQLMKGSDWMRRVPVKPADAFNCSFVAPQQVETVPAVGEKEVQDAAKALMDTAWPACVNSPKGCSPTQGIAFVKTHKTSSNTVDSILQRLCLTRRQRCFTHSGKFVNLAYPEQSSYVAYPHKAAPALSAPYDMFLAHTMNSPDLVNDIVPTSNRHILTIVRDPVTRFKSHWNYWVAPNMKVAPGYPWAAAELDRFCVDVTTNAELKKELSAAPLNIRPALNNMARQLMGCTHCGTPAQERERFDKLLEAIKAPDSKYHVMISEKLHESLMLVKRDYGLEMVDMVYALRNQVSNKAVSPKLASCLKNLNGLDDELYEVASKAHDVRVQSLGEPFQKEVAAFKELVETIDKNCADEGAWNCKKTSSALCQQCESIRSKIDTETVLVSHFKSCKPIIGE